MDTVKRFLNRWKTDYDFKTILTAAASFAVTAVFALYNGFLGISLPSVWYGTICVYYIILTVLRGSIIAAKNGSQRRIIRRIKGKRSALHPPRCCCS